MAGDLFFKYAFQSKPQLGMIVSRKFGNAVQRNLFKRRCRNVFVSGFIRENLNYSVIVRPNKQDISYAEIQDSFLHLKKKFSSE